LKSISIVIIIVIVTTSLALTAGLLQSTVEVIQPQRKKGRSNPDQTCTSTTGLACQACIQAGHSVVTGVLAVAGDAARLLQWACCTPAAVATFEMATALLAWANELCQMSSGAVQQFTFALCCGM